MNQLRAFFSVLYCKLLPVSREYVEARRRADEVVRDSRKITTAINEAAHKDEDPLQHFVDSLKGMRRDDTI